MHQTSLLEKSGGDVWWAILKLKPSQATYIRTCTARMCERRLTLIEQGVITNASD